MKKQNSQLRKGHRNKVENNISIKTKKVVVESKKAKKRKKDVNSGTDRNYYTYLQINKSIKTSIYYYTRQYKPYLQSAGKASSLTKEQFTTIFNKVNETTKLFHYLVKTTKITNETRDEIRDVLIIMRDFLKKMSDPEVDWSVGRYIRKYGFDDFFFSRKEFENGSISLKEALEKIERAVLIAQADVVRNTSKPTFKEKRDIDKRLAKDNIKNIRRQHKKLKDEFKDKVGK